MQITCQIESNNGGNPVRIQRNNLSDCRVPLREILVCINKYSRTVQAAHKYTVFIQFLNSRKELKYIRIFGCIPDRDVSNHIDRVVNAVYTAINKKMNI